MAKQDERYTYELPGTTVDNAPTPTADEGRFTYEVPQPQEAKPQRSWMDWTHNALRSVNQGLMFGLGDEYEAGVKALAGKAGLREDKGYDQYLNTARKEYGDWRKDNFWTDIAGQTVGGIPAAFMPGMGAARVGQVVAQRAAGNATLGQVARASANAGLRTGAAYGFGTGEDGLANRSGNAALGGLAGYVFGGAAGAGVDQAGKVIRNTSQIVQDLARRGGTPVERGVREVGRAIADDGANIPAIRDYVLPRGRGSVAGNTDAVENIVTQIGQLRARGIPDRNIPQMLATDPNVSGLFQHTRGGGTVTPSTVAGHVRNIMRDWDGQNRVPLQIHEIPGFVARRPNGQPGEPFNTNTLMQSAATESSPAAATFRNNLWARNDQVKGIMDDAVRGVLGNRSPDEAMNAAVMAMRDQRNQLYGAARQQAQPFDLQPVFDRWRGVIQRLGQKSETAKKLANALELFRDEVRVPAAGEVVDATAAASRTIRDETGRVVGRIRSRVPLYEERGGQLVRPQQRATGSGTFDNAPPIADLDRFLDRKGMLDDAIEASFENNRPTNLTRQLTALKNEIMDTVGATNPAWRQVNATAAAMFREEDALRMAEQLTLKTGPRARELLAQFDDLTPAAQEVVRLRLMEHISDKIVNAGDGHDVGKFFNSEGGRRILRHVIGRDDVADQFFEQVRRATTSTKSARSLAGSPTQPRQRETEKRSAPEAFFNALSYLNPGNIPKGLSKMLAESNLQDRNQAALRLLGVSTDDPAAFFAALRELNDAVAARNAAMRPMLPGTVVDYGRTLVAPGVPGGVGGVVSSNTIQERR